MRFFRSLVALAACATALSGQAIQGTGNPSSTPNQITITTAWLYANKVSYQGTWSSSATYNSQDLVFYMGASYISLQANNANNTPSGGAPWWVQLPGAALPTLYYQTVAANGSSATQRARLNLIPGTNMGVSCVDNSGTGSTDCTLTATAGGGATKLNGTATFSYGSAIQDGDCLQGPSTITVTGAAVGDPVYMGTSAVLADGLDVFGKVTSSNTVTVEVCNLTGAAQTPGSITYAATVIH